MESLIKTPKHYLFSNKALFVLFLPLLIEQGLEFFVGFADSVMVASLGEAAISGVSLVDFLMQLLIFGFSACLCLCLPAPFSALFQRRFRERKVVLPNRLSGRFFLFFSLCRCFFIRYFGI